MYLPKGWNVTDKAALIWELEWVGIPSVKRIYCCEDGTRAVAIRQELVDIEYLRNPPDYNGYIPPAFRVDVVTCANVRDMQARAKRGELH